MPKAIKILAAGVLALVAAAFIGLGGWATTALVFAAAVGAAYHG